MQPPQALRLIGVVISRRARLPAAVARLVTLLAESAAMYGCPQRTYPLNLT